MLDTIIEIVGLLLKDNIGLYIICFYFLSKVVTELDKSMYIDDLKFDFNRLKFWKWRIRYYIPFYFITIILTHIINSGMGFITSIILSCISLYKVIREYDIWVKKESKKGES